MILSHEFLSKLLTTVEGEWRCELTEGDEVKFSASRKAIVEGNTIKATEPWPKWTIHATQPFRLTIYDPDGLPAMTRDYDLKGTVHIYPEQTLVVLG